MTAPPVKRGRGAKKEAEPVEEEETVEETVEKEEKVTKDNIIAKLREADKKDKKSKVHSPDKLIPWSTNYTVYQDYDATLNQTNIGHNNNKFYLIQVVQNGTNFYWLVN